MYIHLLGESNLMSIGYRTFITAFTVYIYCKGIYPMYLHTTLNC